MKNSRDWTCLIGLKKMYYLVVGLLFISKDVLAMYSTKEMEGYPSGLLADCPGSTKEAFISKKSMKYLSIVLQGPGDKNFSRKYKYQQMKELAKNPAIDFKNKTMLYVGGYMDSPGFMLASSMAELYRKLGYNTLMLDTNYFSTIEYPRAARLMRPVGKLTAKMLVDLTREGMDPKKFEIVAISLGAQTASFIAKNFQQLTGTNVSRITALDPSGPCFRNLGPEERIDKGDADFVELIQTNIDGFGMAAPVGHVNYYVNGGENQAGSIIWFVCSKLCSHIRFHAIWKSALMNPYSFIAIQCDSVQQARNLQCYDKKPLVTNLLGLEADKTKEGIFYISTTNTEPFYLGEKGLKKENDFYGNFISSFNENKIMGM